MYILRHIFLMKQWPIYGFLVPIRYWEHLGLWFDSLKNYSNLQSGVTSSAAEAGNLKWNMSQRPCSQGWMSLSFHQPHALTWGLKLELSWTRRAAGARHASCGADFLSCRQLLDDSRSVTDPGGWLSSVLRLWGSLLETEPSGFSKPFNTTC